MKRVFINYADRGFYQAQQLGIESALRTGGFDRAIPMGRRNLDARFAARNQEILSATRGAGYWLWKPYVLLLAMREIMWEGDILFYADAGCHFIASAASVVTLCLEQPEEKPLLLFSLEPHRINRVWTKRDCFVYMDLDREPYTEAQQVAGTFLVCRKTRYAVDFLQEWLRYAEDPRILTDAPNVCGLPNYPEFQDHRHDQSILSLLAKKHDIATVPDISAWGNDRRSAEIPQIVEHSRWNA